MNKTKIVTAEYTWNPVTGCDNLCFGGDCYAYQIMQRFGKKWGYDWTPLFHDDRLHEPFMLKKPSLIFCPSMGDLYTPSIHSMNIESVIDVMKRCPWHRFLLQTKFAKRLPDFNYPSNVWLGVSICYERDISRLDYLRKTDARIKYAYCEPLLEYIEPDFTDIDWVVIGAKTGAHKFQPHPLWIHKLTRLAFAAGSRVFHKPNLAFPTKYTFPQLPIRQFPDKKWFDWKRSEFKENKEI